MKTSVLLLSLLLLLMLLPPAGHSAHHGHHHSLSNHMARGSRLQLLPLRVLRTPAVAKQPRRVRAVAKQ